MMEGRHRFSGVGYDNPCNTLLTDLPSENTSSCFGNFETETATHRWSILELSNPTVPVSLRLFARTARFFHPSAMVTWLAVFLRENTRPAISLI